MTIVGFLGAADVNFPALRQREPDRNLAGTAGAVALARRPDDDATRGDAAKPVLQHGNVLQYAGAQCLASFHTLKIDLYRGLHVLSPNFRASPLREVGLAASPNVAPRCRPV